MTGTDPSPLTRKDAFALAKADITAARETTELLIREGLTAAPPQNMLQEALAWTVAQVAE